MCQKALFQVILIFMEKEISVIGSGIWGGFFCCVTAGLGILVYFKPSRCRFDVRVQDFSVK